MKFKKKVFKLFENPLYIFLYLNNRGIINLNDEMYLKIRYKAEMRKKLDLNNPKTFNEKLQWLKLHDRKNEYTTMVDKYLAKKYVADIIGEEYIIPTIGVYDSFDDINIDELPTSFVMKCTHDSGGICIVKDKTNYNFKNARRKLNKSLKKNFYKFGREWPYKNVTPKILIEKYMIDEETKELRDYKFFCFNGIPHFFKIDFNRETNHQANYYDCKGNLMDFGEIICPPDFNKNLSMPKKLTQMIELAKKLSKNTIFLRVDFYEINNKVFFGELTFYPNSGFGRFTKEEYDYKIGQLIDLSEMEK